MKRLYKILFVMCFVMVFLVGMTIGTAFFSRIKVLGEQELQEYIDEVTFELVKLFENNGFKVEQSYIIGNLWIQCENLNHFIILARILKQNTIYLHWKIDFLRQPVFYILVNETAIIYEPF